MSLNHLKQTLAIFTALTLAVVPGKAAEKADSSSFAITFSNILFKSSGTNAPSAASLINQSVAALQSAFDRRLEQPAHFSEQAQAECAVFPEGKIYPFALPAMAYANMALANPERKPLAEKQMRKLIELLITSTTKAVRPPDGDLGKMQSIQNQGTYLATLNFVLGNFELISDDRRYHDLHTHLSVLLSQELEQLDGKPIASYPEYTWYFDTIMALASLSLHDGGKNESHAQTLLKKHLAWRSLHAIHEPTGLPIAYQNGLPRGCDLAMQVCLLANMDVKAARVLYADYCAHHWLDYGVMAGFSEWPKGTPSPPAEDVDSGPIIFGIGMTATGVGIGSAKAMGDTEKLFKLARELQLVPQLVKSTKDADGKTNGLFNGQISMKSEYNSGFLYGDAVLFYAVTWTPFPK